MSYQLGHRGAQGASRNSDRAARSRQIEAGCGSRPMGGRGLSTKAGRPLEQGGDVRCRGAGTSLDGVCRRWGGPGMTKTPGGGGRRYAAPVACLNRAHVGDDGGRSEVPGGRSVEGGAGDGGGRGGEMTSVGVCDGLAAGVEALWSAYPSLMRCGRRSHAGVTGGWRHGRAIYVLTGVLRRGSARTDREPDHGFAAVR